MSEAVKAVNTTANVIAILRSIETNDENPMINDPFAEALAGAAGKDWYEQKTNELPEYANYIRELTRTRTKMIDEELVTILKSGNIKQVCVLGSGLDARAWRLESGVQSVKWFEVDYPDMINYKLSIMGRLNVFPRYEHITVRSDLRDVEWSAHLINEGFDISKPTLWLMEGLSMYLSDEEAFAFYSKISKELSAVGSVIISDFIKPIFATHHTSYFSPMWKFMPEDPLKFLESLGWKGSQRSIYEISRTYPKPMAENSATNSYYFVIGSLAS